jgi:hypothetical protein
MWTIPLHLVRATLSLRAAKARADLSLAKALQMAEGQADLKWAIYQAVRDAESVERTRIYAETRALSGPARRAYPVEA